MSQEPTFSLSDVASSFPAGTEVLLVAMLYLRNSDLQKMRQTFWSEYPLWKKKIYLEGRSSFGIVTGVRNCPSERVLLKMKYKVLWGLTHSLLYL